MRWVVAAMSAPAGQGTSFARSSWPAHVTVVGNFATSSSSATLIAEILVTGTTAPIGGTIGEADWFGPRGDVPVRVIESSRLLATHATLAPRAERLPGFAVDAPAQWHAGHRPHITLRASVTAVEGEQWIARSLVLARLDDATATVVAELLLPRS